MVSFEKKMTANEPYEFGEYGSLEHLFDLLVMCWCESD